MQGTNVTIFVQFPTGLTASHEYGVFVANARTRDLKLVHKCPALYSVTLLKYITDSHNTHFASSMLPYPYFPGLNILRLASTACKFMDSNGNGWISDAIRCYDYCTNADAHIISNSWGVYDTSNALQVRNICSDSEILTYILNQSIPLPLSL